MEITTKSYLHHVIKTSFVLSDLFRQIILLLKIVLNYRIFNFSNRSVTMGLCDSYQPRLYLLYYTGKLLVE